MADPLRFGDFGALSKYENLEKIGEGAFSDVYKAKDTITGRNVTLKKLKYTTLKNVPETASREIEILRKLNHPNVIRLEDVVVSSEGEIYMVFEYMDCDLDSLAKRGTFTAPEIKHYVKQLLTGLEYCHANQVLHRDIKGANILVDKKGNLKLADFGQSRSMNEAIDSKDITTGETHSGDYLADILKMLTNSVITLQYRPPEILLGSADYGPQVDIWSVGCLFAELLNDGEKILPGKNTDDQLMKIYQLCGTPNEHTWPGVSNLFYFNDAQRKLPVVYERCLREKFAKFDHEALHLLDRMLLLDPSERISAKEALADAYFSTHA